jgi:hypothetical protein
MEQNPDLSAEGIYPLPLCSPKGTKRSSNLNSLPCVLRAFVVKLFLKIV